MTDPSAALGPLKEMFDGASDYLEFWKDYKGEEILIRTHSVQIGTPDERGKVRQNTYIIRGTVADTTSFPPGFLLKDVEEYIEISDMSMLFGAGSLEPLDTQGGPKAKELVRKIDEKYVSFSNIDELERAEDAEEATEPFRESE